MTAPLGLRVPAAYGHDVVAAVGTGPETLAALAETRPDVAILDVRLPPTFSDEGLQAALAARERVPLTERERSVLELMAEGLSNAAVAGRLFLSEGAISKYTTTIFAKLGLAADDDINRRVRAVLTYLGAAADDDR
ncbi:LuxR C-terminal-related transcriptional regulator [Nonomuraea fuscirosea]